MRCMHHKNPERGLYGSCIGEKFDKCKFRKEPIPVSGCCYKKTEESLKLVGLNDKALRVCVNCGLEAHTIKDLELFKKHSRGDPNYHYYPYGVDACCLRCHRRKDKEYRKRDKVKRPEKYKEIAAKSYREGKEKYRAVGYSFRHLKPDKQCSKCGSVEHLHKHHPDYSRPDFVITLCASCHHKLHMPDQLLGNRNKKS